MRPAAGGLLLVVLNACGEKPEPAPSAAAPAAGAGGTGTITSSGGSAGASAGAAGGKAAGAAGLPSDLPCANPGSAEPPVVATLFTPTDEDFLNPERCFHDD